MSRTYPPGPRDGLLGTTFLRRFQRAPLTFITDIACQYGDFTYVRIGWARLYFVNRPPLIREILTTKANSFRRLPRQMRSLSKMEGKGLAVAEGAAWQRHRPLVQGAFHTRHFEHYALVVVEHTRRRLARWSPGAVLDVAEEMNQLALTITAKLVFDVDLSDQANRLRDAVQRFRTCMMKEMFSPIVLPDWLPLPGKIRKRRALRVIDDLLWSLIRQHRASRAGKNDMLTLMLSAASGMYPEDPITDREIRDEAATLFVAGHDTTSAALAWFWYLLGRNPEVEASLLREVDAVLGGRPATYADLRQLSLTEMAVKESMRLYPAAGVLFGRQAVEEVELGGHMLPRGSMVFMSPYLIHRDPKNYTDAEKFDPGRFRHGRVEAIPPYAYLPFGGGPRICIGSGLALMEIVLLAATVLQHHRLVPDPGQSEVEPAFEVVLRPKGAVKMRTAPREKAGEQAVQARAKETQTASA